MHLHVTLCGKNTVIYGLRRHPLHRKLIVLTSHVIHILSQCAPR